MKQGQGNHNPDQPGSNGFTNGRAIKWALGILVFLVIADGLITNLLINRGIAREGNPFLETLAGDTGLLVVKTIGATVCAVIL
ncbi:MAG: DUF5658 family protein [Dehalococcoidia bacterium]|nr:DUF5658 family protein [Dehalococcoidia bacterium]